MGSGHYDEWLERECDRMAKEIDELRDKLEDSHVTSRLIAKQRKKQFEHDSMLIEMLRTALRPFAVANYKTYPDDRVVWDTCTIGDFRRAYEAMEKTGGIVTEGCGCVFCDLGLPQHGGYHNRGDDLIMCTNTRPD